MSDHLDRAAAIVGGCCAHCDDLVDERLALLDDAGLLVTPERDKERAEVERLRTALIALIEEWEATGRGDSHPLIRAAALSAAGRVRDVLWPEEADDE